VCYSTVRPEAERAALREATLLAAADDVGDDDDDVDGNVDGNDADGGASGVLRGLRSNCTITHPRSAAWPLV
jgi:hypothetical protein